MTVARKYNYNCVYIFHTIYPEKANWQTILSQTNIYNIFPATVPLNSVRKILEGACIRKTSKYIPQASLWISRLFIELANRNDKVCLTLDCSNTKTDQVDFVQKQTILFFNLVIMIITIQDNHQEVLYRWQYPSSLSRRDKPSLPPTPPISPATSLNAMQRFLLHPQKVAEAIGQELTATRPQKITFSDKIEKIFPSSREIIDTIEEEPLS